MLAAGRKHPAQRILILGTGETARMIAREISEGCCPGCKIVGFLCNPGADSSLVYGCPVLGGFEELPQIIRRQRIDRIVLSLRERRKKLPVEGLLEARISGIQIEEGSAFYERIAGKVLLAGLRPSDLFFSSGFRRSRITLIGKRLFEIIISLFILIAASPFLALAAVLIEIDNPGPVLFKQERVGRNGRIFNLLKLRSMRQDAESRTGPIWSEVGDSRVTRVGRVLRKTKIDEIPQVFNVLKGDMSFVGPRPERPYFVELLKGKVPFYFQRLSINPGITGLAQIKYPYGSSVEDAVEKLQYDLYYIKHMSFWLDFSVLFDTVKVVLFGRGGR